MKKLFLVVLSMMMFKMLVACTAPTEAPPEQPTQEVVAATEAPATSAAPTQEAADVADSETTAEESEAASPLKGVVEATECFSSKEAWQYCYDQDLFPDDCFDDNGELIDECYLPEEQEVKQEGASEDVPEGNIPEENVPEKAIRNGFDPAVDSFSFPNYGEENHAINMTSVEMQRMFGNTICANLLDGCTLTPPARQWMEEMNKSMNEGHCEGMAVLSSLMFYHQISPTNFGGNTTSALTIEGNESLQREIAYWFATQVTSPGADQKINESPSVVLNTLIESFNQGSTANEMWVMGICKPDFSGGHAITPIAVSDQGNGIFHVYVYDNNYPNEARVMVIDRNAETWQYEASTNPNVESDLYEGNASTKTLEIVAISPRLQMQEANFNQAALPDGKKLGLAAPLLEGSDVTEIWLDGDANLLITTENGKRVGWLEDGTFVNEIEGAQSTYLKFGVNVWEIEEEPVYLLPANIENFTITVDGSLLEESSPAEVTLIGAGFDIVIEELWLDPGEQDFIEIMKEGEQYFTMNYQSEYSDSPDIWFGIETDEADYEFIVRGADIEAGGAFNVALDFPNGDFILNTTGQEESGSYELLVLRIDDEGEYIFGNDEIELLANDTMYVNFFDWEGEGSKMYLDFDFESDGTLDETIELEDQNNFYDDFYEDWEEEE